MFSSALKQILSASLKFLDNGLFLSPPTKSGGDIGMVSVCVPVHPSVRGFRPLSGKIITQLISNLVYAFLCECSELIRFWPMLAEFWPSRGQKWLKMGQNVGFRPLSEIVFTKSNSSLWCKLVGWVFRINSPLGHVRQILALYSDQKITENGGFRPLSEQKRFTQSNSNLVCTLTRWVFRNDSLLGHVGHILAL